jgi:predicted acylesterase/phospholipase RssA/CRP-like cAMP-binding protein
MAVAGADNLTHNAFDDLWTNPAAHQAPISVPDGTIEWRVLHRSRLCRGFNREQLEWLAAQARGVNFAAGEVICRHGERGEQLYIVVRGRIQLAVPGHEGDFRLLEYVGSGDHFGEMPLLTDGRNVVTATALTECTMLVINREAFQQLLATIPQLGANVSRSLGFQLRWHGSRRRRRWQPRIIGMAHSTLQTQMLLKPLVEALRARDEAVTVLTQRTALPGADGDYAVEQIDDRRLPSDRVSYVRHRVHRLSEVNDRVILDLFQEPADRQLADLLLECEEVLWLAEPRFLDASRQSLERVLTVEPRLAQRVRWVWTLNEEERFAPLLPKVAITPQQFKVPVVDTSPERRRMRHGITLLVRHLAGLHFGLALGGGGARGLAHLGVLRALDEAGIFFDSLVGTSCGALMGAAYAAGWAPEQATRHFQEDLTPGRMWRWLPRAKQWYLWSKFHLGAWDGMLRRYLGECRLEQLPIPLSTVAVDLVSGREIVRDEGDVVQAILESINLPMISRPIVRDGMLLVDGSVLNKLPGDVLVRRGANLVVGVDVSMRLSPRYPRDGRSSGGAPRRPGLVETLLRVHEVQDCGIAALRGSALDLVIAPDTADFEFADFTKAHELAERGYRAACDAIGPLRQLLADAEAA